MELPGYFVGGYFAAGADQFSPGKRHADQKSGEPFAIDDLLDFSNADVIMSDGFLESVAGNSANSSTVTAVESCNSSISGCDNYFPGNIVSHGFAGDPHFSGELCVPYEDMAELEWLSNFVDDSFSAKDDLKTLQLISGATASGANAVGMKPLTPESSSSSNTLPPFAAAADAEAEAEVEADADPNADADADAARNAAFFQPETPLPGKARSKRSRAAPGDWSTRLLPLITPTAAEDETKPVQAKAAPAKRGDGSGSEALARKCLHCGADNTPQWRTGPMGPKTLCNACGVRFKSGRLVPEYRPAASPTFVPTKHSNSHRKVLELRRQKELQRQQQQHQHQHQHLLSQSSIFGVSNGGDEYLIHHPHPHSGPDYRHII